MRDEWTKAERLIVAGHVAPRLRSQDERTANRRVARVDADGNVVGYTTLAEVQAALLKAKQIELETVEGVRPTETVCRRCGRTIAVKRVGRVPTVCKDGCDRRCSTEGCDGLLSVSSAFAHAVAGTKGVCRKCRDASNGDRLANLTPEQVEAGRQRRNATRSQAGRKRAERMTPEERSNVMRKAWETRRARAHGGEHPGAAP